MSTAFRRWLERSVQRASASRAIAPSCCRSSPPGWRRATSLQSRWKRVADWAERYGFGELRVSHEQNLILPDVRADRAARALAGGRGRGARHAEHRTADRHHRLPRRRFLLARQRQVDPDRARTSSAASTISTTCTTSANINLNISGCMNSCGHHHVGHIGVLGVDKDGEEWYQVSIGGADGSALSGGRSAVGTHHRPVVPRRRDARRRCDGWSRPTCSLRHEGERFVDTVRSRRARAVQGQRLSRCRARTRASSRCFRAAGCPPSTSARSSDLTRPGRKTMNAMPIPRVLHADGHLLDDHWHVLRESEGYDHRLPTLLPLAAYQHEAPSTALGVWLAPGDDVFALKERVSLLPLIAIDFPKAADGRGYSLSLLLRTRLQLPGRIARDRRSAGRPDLHAPARGVRAFALRGDQSVEAARSRVESLLGCSTKAQPTAPCRPSAGVPR